MFTANESQVHLKQRSRASGRAEMRFKWALNISSLPHEEHTTGIKEVASVDMESGH